MFPSCFEPSVNDTANILQASKGPIANQLYVRLVEDIRYVVNQVEVLSLNTKI